MTLEQLAVSSQAPQYLYTPKGNALWVPGLVELVLFMETYKMKNLCDLDRFRFGDWLHSLGLANLEGLNVEIEDLMVRYIAKQPFVTELDKRLGLLSMFIDQAITELGHYHSEWQASYEPETEMRFYNDSMPELMRKFRLQWQTTMDREECVPF